MIPIRKHYSEEDKLSLLRSYYQSGMSKRSFCHHHGICGITLLNRWLQKYDYLSEQLSLPSEPESTAMSNRSKEEYKEENAQLKKRIKELEKALSFSKPEFWIRKLSHLVRERHEYFQRSTFCSPLPYIDVKIVFSRTRSIARTCLPFRI